MKKMRMATCHPDRRHEAKGLCTSCYNRERLKLSPEKIRKRNEHSRIRYHENRGYNRERRKAYQTANAEARSEYHKKHRRTNLGRWSALKFAAKSKELPLTLTFEEFEALLQLPCFYCGESLYGAGYGLDRIDSEFGYERGNVRPCCKQCNIAKNAYSEEEFREWICKVFVNYATRRALGAVA